MASSKTALTRRRTSTGRRHSDLATHLGEHMNARRENDLFRNATIRCGVLHLALCVLLALPASSVLAQPQVVKTNGEAHGRLHASSSNSSARSTRHAAANAAVVPLHRPSGSVAKHMPAQAKPHRPPMAQSRAHSSVAPLPAQHTHPSPRVYTARQPKWQPPAGPGPLHGASHRSNAKNSHGIVFVGGNNAINSQPVPPGRQAHDAPTLPPGHQPRALHPIGPRPAEPARSNDPAPLPQ